MIQVEELQTGKNEMNDFLKTLLKKRNLEVCKQIVGHLNHLTQKNATHLYSDKKNKCNIAYMIVLLKVVMLSIALQNKEAICHLIPTPHWKFDLYRSGVSAGFRNILKSRC